MAIAEDAQHRFGKVVSWGVHIAGEAQLFTTASVPVMTRLRLPAEAHAQNPAVCTDPAERGSGEDIPINDEARQHRATIAYVLSSGSTRVLKIGHFSPSGCYFFDPCLSLSAGSSSPI